jgi:hypothetical protein
MRISTALASLVLVGLVVRSGYGETPAEKEIRELVDQLASKNPRPKDAGRRPYGYGLTPGLPPGFEMKEQRRVRDVVGELKKLGTAAFPYLIERFDDKSYSATVEHFYSSEASHWSVGRMCQAIIEDQLQPYGLYSKADDPPTYPRRPVYPLPEGKAEAAKWWDGNKKKDLRQLQLEVLDWVIAGEAKPQEDGLAYHADEAKYLQGRREKLTKGKQPLPAGNLSGFEIMVVYQGR